ncbi:MAG: FMN-binding protein [Bacteroidetes bacterium]|nr:FMN-binding protein [Bacteroidota bacterium]MBL6944598.1 FMN-binding protein [Bacteroidales bacterium]
MNKKVILIISITAFCMLAASFTNTNEINIPFSKIEKTIKKKMGFQEFLLESVDVVVEPNSQSEVFRIQSNNQTLGYVYVSRVNTCRAGGCSINPDDIAVDFEYFDYFLLTDSVGNVVNVKVYNYRATHGHQVMSRGWLKQFFGFNGSQTLNYGKDIQAISGATISAKTLIFDIQNAEILIRSLIID